MSPNDPNRDEAVVALGKAIRVLRQKRGITQEELASVVEVHPTYISMIEAGRRNAVWGTVRRISIGLGVPVSELAKLAEEIQRKS